MCIAGYDGEGTLKNSNPAQLDCLAFWRKKKKMCAAQHVWSEPTAIRGSPGGDGGGGGDTAGEPDGGSDLPHLRGGRASGKQVSQQPRPPAERSGRGEVVVRDTAVVLDGGDCKTLLADTNEWPAGVGGGDGDGGRGGYGGGYG